MRAPASQAWRTRLQTATTAMSPASRAISRSRLAISAWKSATRRRELLVFMAAAFLCISETEASRARCSGQPKNCQMPIPFRPMSRGSPAWVDQAPPPGSTSRTSRRCTGSWLGYIATLTGACRPAALPGSSHTDPDAQRAGRRQAIAGRVDHQIRTPCADSKVRPSIAGKQYEMPAQPRQEQHPENNAEPLVNSLADGFQDGPSRRVWRVCFHQRSPPP